MYIGKVNLLFIKSSSISQILLANIIFAMPTISGILIINIDIITFKLMINFKLPSDIDIFNISLSNICIYTARKVIKNPIVTPEKISPKGVLEIGIGPKE